jgi:hypothetical protein
MNKYQGKDIRVADDSCYNGCGYRGKLEIRADGSFLVIGDETTAKANQLKQVAFRQSDIFFISAFQESAEAEKTIRVQLKKSYGALREC